MNNIKTIEEKEIWKDLQGFENLYSISNFGQVKSLKTGRMLKIAVGAEGYYRCTLITKDKKMPYALHRLIALTFLDNPNNLPMVHHKNHNKLDNRIENLEWVTKKDNSRMAAESGRYKKDYIKKKNFSKRLTKASIPKFYCQEFLLEDEVWVDIINFEDYYQVSNYGRIKSKIRAVDGLSSTGRPYKKVRRSQFIRPSFGRDSYLRVGLHKKGRVKGFSIHQLVAKHFITNPSGLVCINHLDSNPMNNHVSNLEWTNYIKNNLYARTNGNWDERGERSCVSKLTESQVLEIRANINNKSIGFLSRQYGVTRKCISNILNRKSWKHI